MRAHIAVGQKTFLLHRRPSDILRVVGNKGAPRTKHLYPATFFATLKLTTKWREKGTGLLKDSTIRQKASSGVARTVRSRVGFVPPKKLNTCPISHLGSKKQPVQRLH